MRHLSPPAAFALAAVLGAALAACARLPRPVLSPAEAALAQDSALRRLATDADALLRSYDLSAVPPRPRLPGSAPDTNDAASYYEYGLDVFARDPAAAAAAFGWSTRLDPMFAEAYYCRWLALQQLREPRRLADGTLRAAATPTEAQAARIDSLPGLAMALNPFIETAATPAVAPAARLDRSARGRQAFAKGRYDSAVKLWGGVLDAHPDSLSLRVWRARAMFFLRRYADAAQELTVALDAVRAAERDSGVAATLPKEWLAYGIGVLQAQRGDRAAARAAYEDAIVENAGFHMAHTRLAGLALLSGDTTTALVEYETSLAIRPDDPSVHLLYGYALFQAGRPEDAERSLREAVRLAPDFAAPHAYLARVLEARHAPDARDEYLAFLARASRRDPELAPARGRLSALAAR